MPRFGNIELSDPFYEPNHLRFLTFNSHALRGRGDVILFVPPNSENETNLPLVLLLPGVYDSHWAWAFKGGAHLTAAAMIASVMQQASYALPGFDGLIHSTVPFGSGLSSSAAIETATAVTFQQLGGYELDLVVMAQLANWQRMNLWASAPASSTNTARTWGKPGMPTSLTAATLPVTRLFQDSYAGARDLFEIGAPAMETMMQAMQSAPGVVAASAGAGPLS